MGMHSTHSARPGQILFMGGFFRRRLFIRVWLGGWTEPEQSSNELNGDPEKGLNDGCKDALNGIHDGSSLSQGCGFEPSKVAVRAVVRRKECKWRVLD